ncbi:hypothetical protein PG996_011057 [Apiospora saccharicola]|uniref:PiggyBac transposable element-derived protein domain-containing protein n=1 Tax=Apiospora saccharicola TaxID=335842 RepID=A0ABR1UE13_9PEZI
MPTSQTPKFGLLGGRNAFHGLQMVTDMPLVRPCLDTADMQVAHPRVEWRNCRAYSDSNSGDLVNYNQRSIGLRAPVKALSESKARWYLGWDKSNNVDKFIETFSQGTPMNELFAKEMNKFGRYLYAKGITRKDNLLMIWQDLKMPDTDKRNITFMHKDNPRMGAFN